MIDVMKYHFLGEVDYAQHNFARLRPLLYSIDGRSWTGDVKAEWFPNAGLIFSVAPDLRYAPVGSLWTFQVHKNERQSNSEDAKDAFITFQIKPATVFLTEMERLPPEQLRVVATIDGFDPKGRVGGVVFPEENDRWIVASEIERTDDNRARVTTDRLLSRMPVLEGQLEQIAGRPTPDGRWVLPIIISSHRAGVRNWRTPSAFMIQLASDLKRWLPHAPHKARATTAANALRDLAPVLDGLVALRSAEAQAVLDRALLLTKDAKILTCVVDDLVETLLSTPAIAEAIELEKLTIREALNEEALQSAVRLEGETRARLEAEHADMTSALEDDRQKLKEIRAESESTILSIDETRRKQKAETVLFKKSLESLIARARTEPAAYAAEWLAKAGLESTSIIMPAQEPEISPHEAVSRSIDEADLGRALSRLSPIRNSGLPKFLLLDAAIRARELVIAHGPRARDTIETWLTGLAPLATIVGAADPTILSFSELLPTGPRNSAAPLSAAIQRARSFPDRPVVALLDDIDVSAGGYWLPAAARALRRPISHGLPANLFLVGLIEGDPSAMNFSLARLGELFPMTFDEGTRVEREPGDFGIELSLTLFETPLTMNGVDNRVRAFSNAVGRSFNSEDTKSIAVGFHAFLDWTKYGGEKPGDTVPMAGTLVTAATKMLRGDG